MSKAKEQDIDFFGVIILILSVYVLSALIIDSLFVLDPEVSTILGIADDLVCAVFFIEFCIRFIRADNKWVFMRLGWIDLISSIPSFSYLRWGRIFSLFRLLRIIRAIRSTKELIQHFRKKRVESTLLSMSLLGILLLIFSSILILKVENVPNGNIKTASDAVWWAFTTISTIGYGEFYPVSNAGRMIAGVLIVFGVGVFGTLSGLIASWFLGHQK
jgi:voltage-gated potassium channel